jgi:hypothetical protein
MLEKFRSNEPAIKFIQFVLVCWKTEKRICSSVVLKNFQVLYNRMKESKFEHWPFIRLLLKVNLSHFDVL